MPAALQGAQTPGTEHTWLRRASPASSEPLSPQPGASDPPHCPTGARSRDQPLRDEDGCQRMEVSDSAGRCRDGPSAPDRPRRAGPGPTPSPTATCARSLGQLSPARESHCDRATVCWLGGVLVPN